MAGMGKVPLAGGEFAESGLVCIGLEDMLMMVERLHNEVFGLTGGCWDVNCMAFRCVGVQ